MNRMTPREQRDNYAITREVAADAREMRNEFRQLDKRIAELAAALRPFASMPDHHDLEDNEIVYSSAGQHLTAGDIRRAIRAAEVEGPTT